MNIAFLFSGHKRSFLNYKQKWKNLIFDLENNGAIVHCFFHSWTEDCLVKHVNGNRIEGSYIKKPLGNKQLILDGMPFMHGVFEDEKNVIPQLNIPKNTLLLGKQSAKINIALQLYSMQQSYNIMKEYEEKNNIVYTTIVKIRFDIDPRIWFVREFLLFNDRRFYKLIIAPNESVHRHPGGGGGCLLCEKKHQQWLDKGQEGPIWLHDGPHTNDICDLYAIGNQETMGRYMTLYSRLCDIYTPEIFEKSIRVSKSVSSSMWKEEDDFRFISEIKEIERQEIACFYPERLQRINLEGFSVLHAASCFYRS